MTTLKDYTDRLPFEQLHPQMPVQDRPPFAFDLPEVPNLQKKDILEKVQRYSKLFTDYWFQFPFNIPRRTTQTLTANVQNNCYFALMYWIIAPNDAETGIERFEMVIEDSGANMSFMNTPVISDLVAGTAQNPFWLANQIVFHPLCSIQITCTDLAAAGDFNVFWILLGGRRYHI